MLESILAAYQIDQAKSSIEIISSGLINPTWKITSGQAEYILQRINTNVFREPSKLAQNIRQLAIYTSQHQPDYLFVAPLPDRRGNELVVADDKVYRLFPFVKDSHTIASVVTPGQAYEAAFQFGKFTRVFSGFDATRLHKTIPDFHNLTFRFEQFKTSLKEGNLDRIKECAVQIMEVKNYSYLADQFESIKRNPAFQLRVTHHDTKISNVLFDLTDRGICVIDLDTVMPGYFISDVGDMLRTYLCQANEEEAELSKIEVRDDFYHAIKQGYLEQMGNELSTFEREMFFFSGLFMIYMQAIRFLTDYFNDDRYYGTRYDFQNMVRAKNQLRLLDELLKKEKSYQKI
jgi:thiamine kinase-like enzyme